MSPKYQLNQLDWQKIGKGALIAFIGALGTYAIGIAGEIDWGVWAPAAAALISILANALNRFLAGEKEKPQVIEQV